MVYLAVVKGSIGGDANEAVDIVSRGGCVSTGLNLSCASGCESYDSRPSKTGVYRSLQGIRRDFSRKFATNLRKFHRKILYQKSGDCMGKSHGTT